MDAILNVDSISMLATLSVLEIVLGIDNLVMLALLVGGLPDHLQDVGRRLGIGFALLTRCMLLFTMSTLARMTQPVFYMSAHPVSVRDLVMLAGGAFLIYKGLSELRNLTSVEEDREQPDIKGGKYLLLAAFQIGLMDIVFSLDSVITAVGISNQLPIMITAVCIAMAVMLFASAPIIKIIDKYIEIKVIALCFVLLVGVFLVFSGFGVEIPKGYLYSAMGFTLFTQAMLLMVSRRIRKD
ncbi:TerC family protein [Deferribacterales bacterium RsTz2092]|nr:membrane protein [Deferribacterales bacterium]